MSVMKATSVACCGDYEDCTFQLHGFQWSKGKNQWIQEYILLEKLFWLFKFQATNYI
jgi:hypothetical protein